MSHCRYQADVVKPDNIRIRMNTLRLFLSLNIVIERLYYCNRLTTFGTPVCWMYNHIEYLSPYILLDIPAKVAMRTYFIKRGCFTLVIVRSIKVIWWARYVPTSSRTVTAVLPLVWFYFNGDYCRPI